MTNKIKPFCVAIEAYNINALIELRDECVKSGAVIGRNWNWNSCRETHQYFGITGNNCLHLANNLGDFNNNIIPNHDAAMKHITSSNLDEPTLDVGISFEQLTEMLSLGITIRHRSPTELGAVHGLNNYTIKSMADLLDLIDAIKSLDKLQTVDDDDFILDDEL